jgi:hypothetical protein
MRRFGTRFISYAARDFDALSASRGF